MYDGNGGEFRMMQAIRGRTEDIEQYCVVTG
jgi:hypothetical protein